MKRLSIISFTLIAVLFVPLVTHAAQGFSPTEAAKYNSVYVPRKGGTTYVRNVRRSIKNQAAAQVGAELREVIEGSRSTRINRLTDIFSFKEGLRSTQHKATDSDTTLARREAALKRRQALRDQYRQNFGRTTGRVVEFTDQVKNLSRGRLSPGSNRLQTSDDPCMMIYSRQRRANCYYQLNHSTDSFD